MATTIESAFQKLKENLEITDLQEFTVSTRQNNVRKAIKKKMDVLDSFLTGSYRRHTMIAPLTDADIDIFIILNSRYYENNYQKRLLDNVRRVLRKTYKSPKISRNGQAVTITFTDFKVDVVPAFEIEGGDFLIPDSIGKRWIATNPKVHVEVVSGKNRKHNGELVPIIKMIKGWNRNINNAFVSFYLELLTINIFDSSTISDYPLGMYYFFDKGQEKIEYEVVDPVGYGEQISQLNNINTVQEAVSIFTDAYYCAEMAVQYGKKGMIKEAINEWRKIFGNYFPTYG